MKNRTNKYKFKEFKVTRLISLALCCLTISIALGCASPGAKTGEGAGAGGLTGAAVGGATGGLKGAAIGAAAGAAIGGAIGNILDKQAKELNQVADTKRTEEGILVKLKSDLLFKTDSAALKDQAVQDVTNLGDILAKYPKDRIRIEGYTDNRGRSAYNDTLSLRRADAVKNILIGRGVKPSQILTLGAGENNPVASNKTAQGRAANRRVELHIDVAQA